MICKSPGACTSEMQWFGGTYETNTFKETVLDAFEGFNISHPREKETPLPQKPLQGFFTFRTFTPQVPKAKQQDLCPKMSHKIKQKTSTI